MDEMLQLLDSQINERRSRHEGIYFQKTERPVLGASRGERYSVDFKVSGRMLYSALLFTYWIDRENSAIYIEWGEQTIICRSESELRRILNSIFNDPVVAKSIAQLKGYEDKDWFEGIVRSTEDPNMLAGKDFMIEIPSDQFQIIEDAYNTSNPDETFTFSARESNPRRLSGKYLPNFTYYFVESQGLIMEILKIRPINGKLEFDVRHYDPGSSATF